MPKRLLGHQRQKCLIIMLQLADRLKSTAPRLMPQGSNLLGAEIGNGNDDIRSAAIAPKQTKDPLPGIVPCNRAVKLFQQTREIIERICEHSPVFVAVKVKPRTLHVKTNTDGRAGVEPAEMIRLSRCFLRTHSKTRQPY
ncbi:MAG: hypothetical protein P8X66_16125 [Maritimibacter sp.]